jgi:thiol:disulfide interchange protein DsbD
MRNLLRLFLSLITTFVLAGNQTVFTSLSLTEAQSLSKKESKPILLKFHADWCHNCTIMDRTTFKDLNVQNKLDNYIPVKIDVDTRLGQQTAKAYGISAIPVVLVLDVDGHEIFRAVGYQSPKKFVQHLSKITGK